MSSGESLEKLVHAGVTELRKRTEQFKQRIAKLRSQFAITEAELENAGVRSNLVAKGEDGFGVAWLKHSSQSYEILVVQPNAAPHEQSVPWKQASLDAILKAAPLLPHLLESAVDWAEGRVAKLDTLANADHLGLNSEDA